jgi:hypothetical protein
MAPSKQTWVMKKKTVNREEVQELKATPKATVSPAILPAFSQD